jgi:hypothetical protein
VINVVSLITISAGKVARGGGVRCIWLCLNICSLWRINAPASGMVWAQAPTLNWKTKTTKADWMGRMNPPMNRGHLTQPEHNVGWQKCQGFIQPTPSF